MWSVILIRATEYRNVFSITDIRITILHTTDYENDFPITSFLKSVIRKRCAIRFGLRPERNLVETELLNRFTGNELCEVCMNECMQWCCELWKLRCEMLWLQYWDCWNFNVEKLELQRVGWLYSVCAHKTMTISPGWILYTRGYKRQSKKWTFETSAGSEILLDEKTFCPRCQWRL